MNVDTKKATGRQRPIGKMSQKEQEFCNRLTELCLEFGFGITGDEDPTSMSIYELQTGSDTDYDRIFYLDEDQKLQFN